MTTITNHEEFEAFVESLEKDEELPLHDKIMKLFEVLNVEYMDGEFITDISEEYAEPGYSKRDDGPIYFGDWNEKKYNDPSFEDCIPALIGDALETLGCTIEWFDEWGTCYACQRAFRTEPNSYSWKPYYFFAEESCELFCGDCAKGDEEVRDIYIQSLINNHNACATFLNDDDMIELGFERVNDDSYRNDWDDRNDLPQTILENRLNYEPDSENVFTLDENSQFYITFSLWTRTNNNEEEE